MYPNQITNKLRQIVQNKDISFFLGVSFLNSFLSPSELPQDENYSVDVLQKTEDKPGCEVM